MTDTLRYNVAEEGIVVAMPEQVFSSALEGGETLARIVELPDRRQFTDVEAADGSVSVLFNTQKVGSTRGYELKQSKKDDILVSISELERAAARLDLEDPRFRIVIGHQEMGYGVYGMESRVEWPTVPDRHASLLATRAMRQTARNLRTYPSRQINDLVMAGVSRGQGMTFETNPAGACSMDTDGSDYRPGQERVRLHSHNLYARDMQLICIAGIIAVARAETPETP